MNKHFFKLCFSRLRAGIRDCEPGEFPLAKEAALAYFGQADATLVRWVKGYVCQKFSERPATTFEESLQNHYAQSWLENIHEKSFLEIISTTYRGE
jgi:hypothetical protein